MWTRRCVPPAPLPRQRAALVAAAKAGLPSLDAHLIGVALGSVGAMEDWLERESTQRLDDE